MAAERGWLIGKCNEHVWWTGSHIVPWSHNAHDAVRFSRREDAQRVLKFIIEEEHHTMYDVTEHSWTPTP